MQLRPYVLQVQSHLTAAAALGDESTRSIADALANAAEPAVRLAVLGAVSAAADEITAALLDAPGAPVVSVHTDGDELRVDVRLSEPAGPPEHSGVGGPDEADSADNTARISLRLSEALKAQIEAAARSNAASVNTWLQHAAATALSGSSSRGRKRGPGPGGGYHVTGWING